MKGIYNNLITPIFAQYDKESMFYVLACFVVIPMKRFTFVTENLPFF